MMYIPSMSSQPSAQKHVHWKPLSKGPGAVVDSMVRGEVRHVRFRDRPIATIRRLKYLAKDEPEEPAVQAAQTVTQEEFQQASRRVRMLLENGPLVFRRFGTAEAIIEPVQREPVQRS